MKLYRVQNGLLNLAAKNVGNCLKDTFVCVTHDAASILSINLIYLGPFNRFSEKTFFYKVTVLANVWGQELFALKK